MTRVGSDVVQRLREFLEAQRFKQQFKYATGINHYFADPFSVSQRGGLPPSDESDSACQLLACLCGDNTVDLSQLTGSLRSLADDLIDAGLLCCRDAVAGNAGWQLISVHDLYLFIDTGLNFPQRRFHETYIGYDSYLLLYYLDSARISRHHKALDLGTGSGVLGLYLSRFCDQVTITDISEQALALADVNCRLNERAVTLRLEEYGTTLSREAGYDWIVCNPPFVAIPERLQAPGFARGTGTDGLDYLRDIIAALSYRLADRGQASIVADLIGDERGPYLLQELEALAGQARIDVFIDGCISARNQAHALGRILARLNPDRTVPDIVAELREFQSQTLRARYYYLSVIQITCSSVQTGLRVFDRYQQLRACNARKRFMNLVRASD